MSSDISPADTGWRLLYDLATLPLCFALMILLWSLASGEVPWWMWAGLAWFGGLGVWAAALSSTGRRSHE